MNADRERNGALVVKDFCTLTKKLAHRFCPRTIRRKVSADEVFPVCVYHNTRYDRDNLYIHRIMNTKYKKGGKYQISKAIQEHPYIRLVYWTGRTGDYPALRKLLYKLDKSEHIRRAIKLVDPKPRDIRDYYGNYEAFFPDENKSSRIYHELEWLLLNGGRLTHKRQREFCRKYHETAEIIKICHEWVQKDLEKFSPQELRIFRDIEKDNRCRRIKKKPSKDSNK